MRLIQLILFIALILTGIESKTQNTFIRGKIINYSDGVISVKYTYDVKTLDDVHLIFDVNAQGEFEAELIIKDPTVVQLYFDGKVIPLYIEEHKDVGLVFDVNDFPTSITFFEKDQTKNNQSNLAFREWQNLDFSNQIISFYPYLLIDPSLYEQLKPGNSQQRFELIYKRLKSALSHFDININDQKISQTFKSYLKNQIEFSATAYLKQFVNRVDLSIADKISYDSLINLSLQNYIDSNFYANMFLDAYALSDTTLVKKDQSYFDDFEIYYQNIRGSEKYDSIQKTQLLGRLMFLNSIPRKALRAKEYVYDFLAYSKNESLNKSVKERFDLAYQFLEGQASPTFTLMDTKGNKVSLKEFNGKPTYLSFWAEWCANCKIEMFNAENNRIQLSQKMNFVYISLDKKKSVWESHDVINDVKGIHLWAGDQYNDITKKFGIASLPKNFMIDKHGNFINNFPNSDNESFIDFINQLK